MLNQKYSPFVRCGLCCFRRRQIASLVNSRINCLLLATLSILVAGVVVLEHCKV